MTIWCVGRNYEEHAKELGNKSPSEPIFFIKSEGTLVKSSQIEIPKNCRSLHYELEVAFVLEKNSAGLVSATHVGLALDLTDRVTQSELKNKGLPWSLAKSFKNSCPISPFIPLKMINNEAQKNLSSTDFLFELWINSVEKQNDTTQNMTFSLKILIDFLNHNFPVQSGDILLTGTPKGVGELKPGDHLKSFLKTLDGKKILEWNFSISPL